jgi:hypothetical protein
MLTGAKRQLQPQRGRCCGPVQHKTGANGPTHMPSLWYSPTLSLAHEAVEELLLRIGTFKILK